LGVSLKLVHHLLALPVEHDDSGSVVRLAEKLHKSDRVLGVIVLAISARSIGTF
jgi:hypothetical protein